MASARITCPECKSVLRPAKAVADGKKVKCPECGTIFTTPGLIEEDESPRPKPSAKKQNKAGIKKAEGGIKKAGAVKPPPTPNKTDDDDDDDGGGIYSLVGASEEKKSEDEEEDRPQIEYAPDMSIKDLRGPAQSAVIKPSNYMLLLGGINCIANVFLICKSFWPMVFSQSVLVDWQKPLMNYYMSKEDKSGMNRIKSLKGDDDDYKALKDKELDLVHELEDEERVELFIYMGVFIFLFIYTGIAIFGTVKMQNLESRGWGIASSIMFILPMASGGAGYLLFWGFHNTIGDWIMDEKTPGVFPGYSIGLGVIPYLVALVVGIWALRTLLSKEVIDGFNYIPD